MFSSLLNLIEKHEIITLFRHVNEDCDALGSQFGLKNWIKENYPEKKVYALGERYGLNFFDQSDEISDQIIKDSLAIVLDCASSNRVDDQRFLNAKYIIAIDHHPFQDDFMNDDFRFVNYGATTEILTAFFDSCDKVFSKETATCLYRGLLTDTMSFKTNNTTAHTLKMAAVLCEKGIDIVRCNQDVYDISLNDFKVANDLRYNATIQDNGLVYAIITLEKAKQLNTSPQKIKDMIYQFQGVKDFEIWAIFAEETNQIYKGSLRSKNIIVRTIAEQYNGGGHDFACGVKNLSLEDVKTCLDKLNDLLK